MSKGSNIRPYNRDRFKQNFERIFGGDIAEILEQEKDNVPETSGQEPVVEGEESTE